LAFIHRALRRWFRTDLDQAHHLELGGKGRHYRGHLMPTSTCRKVWRRLLSASGAKCLACSRAIVDERVYDKFLDQLKSRVEKIKIVILRKAQPWARSSTKDDEDILSH
jgi:acyl-CoA reductase-like NAD-dependent aldehyde dehydrogenase